MTDELEVLAPSGASVTYRNETIDVLPLTIGVLPKLVRMARPVIDTLMTADIEGDDPAKFAEVLLNMIEAHGEQLYVAAALCVDRPEEFIARGDLAEFLDLAKAIFEVNRDFFAQRLGPLLADRMGAAKASAGTGQTASSS